MESCSYAPLLALLLLLLLVGDVRACGPLQEPGVLCSITRDTSKDLSHHNLTQVPYHLPEVIQSLDLSSNSITSLEDGHLHSLPALCILSLSHNRLCSIPANAFQDNGRLQLLNLSSNALAVIPDLGSLPHLRVLDLSDNLYESYSLGLSYRSLDSLSSLSLGSPQVTSINKADFSPLQSIPLKTLQLGSGAEMDQYQPGSLPQLSSLQELTLNMAFCKTPRVLQDILHDLHSSQMTNLTIVNPNLCNLSVDLFEELRHMKNLRKITFRDWSVKSSQTTTVFRNIFQSPIETLSCVNTTYSEDTPEGVQIHNIPGFNKTANLRAFSYDNVNKGFLGIPKIFINESFLASLVKLRITGTEMNFMLCYLICDLPHLQVLDLSKQHLKSIGLWNFKCADSPIFPALTELILRENEFCDLHVIATHTNQMSRLTYLDLSANRIILDKRPSWPSHLTHLSLSENPLGNTVFNHLSPYFRSLNLSQTRIESLSQDNIRVMNDLKSLFLSSNKIISLPPNLHSLSLEELHLDNNNINSLHKDSFTGLPNMRKFKAGHNPFTCDCDLYWFVTSFNKSILVDWPSDYKCSSPSNLAGTALSDFHPGRLSCDPWLQLAVWLPTVLCVCAAVGLVFYAVDGAWYLRMLWVWVRVKRRGQREAERLLHAALNYHAFISYSQRDSHWVDSQLIPHLEGAHFNLCVHQRDFVPGYGIIDNIINCVEKSYKTLFVLSQNFVRSEWCNYELFFAQHRALCERQDSLVFVLLEPIPADSLPRKFLRLRTLLQQQTYLEWPAEEQKRRVFWASLRAVLHPADRNMELQKVAREVADLCLQHTLVDERAD